MLAAAVPRLRLAALPQPLRRPLGRSQWSLPRRRPLSSSVPNVTPAAGAGELEPPDLPRLATAARISLSPQEVEEFAPKIQQVVDGLGNFRQSILNPLSLHLAGMAADSSLREDKPETFANRDAIVEALPSYDDPYIKVPRVLNKE